MNRYEQSETMKLLGHQYITRILTDDNLTQIREVLRTYNSPVLTDPYMCGTDIFVLGYIYGKRAERAKKKEKATR